MDDQARLIDVSNFEEITHFVIGEGHGVKGLSETGIKGLPKQYIQPPSERTANIKKAEPQESIPVVDLSMWDDPTVGKLICDAAEKWGFFQVINHGVAMEVLEGVKEATHRFFGLPPEEKRKYFKEHSASNHVRLSTSFIPEAESALEWKDYLSLFYVSEEEALALWPAVCRDQLLDYMKKCEVIIKPLVQVLMNGLDIKNIDNQMESLLTGSKRINLNYYPKCPKPELTVGVGRHSDVSTFTILLQDEVGGLYVRGLDGESWIHVPPIDGALVINIGDALQIMSNGRYKSIEHRVVANGNDDRISIPLFVNPKPSDLIGPLEEVMVKSGEKAKYKQVVYSDYVLHFYRKAHHGKDTLEFARV
ncbi:hypothetical protein Nepgr_026336 [Nepenthes gracilis]|uniref:Fe2OG dioxygenase domain-containing protein n=1 Tax=Nepenthes gracilis TaxID=150966 RepID=A0AAD3Y0G8_NEPGR|nr:hypothetical protein Nepgr_026336 [Nepenthes gracilis]